MSAVESRARWSGSRSETVSGAALVEGASDPIEGRPAPRDRKGVLPARWSRRSAPPSKGAAHLLSRYGGPRLTRRRVVELIRGCPAARRLIYGGGRRRALALVSSLEPELVGVRSVLDIGTGTGNVAEVLRERGLKVTPVDIENLSFIGSVAPLIYDGHRLPFAARAFDAALLSTVLHHTEDAGRLLRDARRVSGRVIVVEDIHRSRLHRAVCSLLDRLLNLELGGQLAYRSDAEWRSLFQRTGLRVARMRGTSSFGIFRHVAYELERAA
jgi:SAM-dependent methyltransferase